MEGGDQIGELGDGAWAVDEVAGEDEGRGFVVGDEGGEAGGDSFDAEEREQAALVAFGEFVAEVEVGDGEPGFGGVDECEA